MGGGALRRDAARSVPMDDMQEQHVTNDAARETPFDALTSDEVEAAAAAEVDLTQAAHVLPGEASTTDGEDPGDGVSTGEASTGEVSTVEGSKGEASTVEASTDEDQGAEVTIDESSGDDGGERSFAPEEFPGGDPRSKEELLVELGEAELRRDEYLDDLRRARAEFENFRKRTLREGASQREVGKAEVLADLLEVLDDLERTLAAAEGSTDEALAKGVTLVAEKLTRSLEGQGLERVDETGVAFDPNVHEAVQQQPSDDPRDEPTVAEVLRPGYRIHDRVLRAAMVVVEQ